jgi:hypothetical protein
LDESRRVHLTFHGVDSCIHVWVNGHLIGYSQDSRMPAEFDITSALYPNADDENVVAVRVVRWCDGSYMEDQVRKRPFFFCAQGSVQRSKYVSIEHRLTWASSQGQCE